jgi:HK97 family phage major capsid protein
MEGKTMTTEEAIERIENSIAEKTSGLASREEIDGLKSELAAVKEIAEKNDDADAAMEMKTAIAKLEGKVEALKEAKADDAPKAKSLGEAIAMAFKSAKDRIVEIAEKGAGSVKLDVKAAGTMTINGNYSGGTVGLSTLESGFTRVQRRQPFMRELVNSAGTNSKYVVWIEQANPDPGEAGMTAEGAPKTQTDFDLVERSCDVKKITAWIKVSKEMIADLPFMAGEINGELMELVALKLDQQILSGDGVGNNMTGIEANATAWAAGSFAGQIDNANNSDVLRVGIAQVANNNFMANYILLNPEDCAAMQLTKSSTGEYTYPMFIEGADGITRVKGIPVIENPGVTAGSFLIGDFTKSNLRIREEMNISVGYVDDDFTNNLMTVLCEARACHFVKTNHYGAFVSGTFTAAKAALETP